MCFAILLYKYARTEHLSKSKVLVLKREGPDGRKVGRERGKEWKEGGVWRGEEEYFSLIETYVIENRERRSA